MPENPAKERAARFYNKGEMEKFVMLLGLWGYPDPWRQVHRRTSFEYRGLLLKLIEVNKTRKDEIGKYETLIAMRELKALEV